MMFLHTTSPSTATIQVSEHDMVDFSYAQKHNPTEDTADTVSFPKCPDRLWALVFFPRG